MDEIQPDIPANNVREVLVDGFRAYRCDDCGKTSATRYYLETRHRQTQYCIDAQNDRTANRVVPRAGEWDHWRDQSAPTSADESDEISGSSEDVFEHLADDRIDDGGYYYFGYSSDSGEGEEDSGSDSDEDFGEAEAAPDEGDEHEGASEDDGDEDVLDRELQEGIANLAPDRPAVPIGLQEVRSREPIDIEWTRAKQADIPDDAWPIIRLKRFTLVANLSSRCTDGNRTNRF